MSNLSPAIQAMLAKSSVTKVDAMESGGGGDVPRISLKKSKFTAKVGDDETKLGEEIDVVIVGITPPTGFCHTYYKEAYQPGSSDVPDCQSEDGIRPDASVSNPESDMCRTCPQQVWGSAVSMSGGKAKACKDTKRLYVKLAEDLSKKEAPVYLVSVTVMSLKPFSAYGKLLANEGIPSPAIAITKLSFDEEASVPKLNFALVGVMDDENVATALAIAEEKVWGQKIVVPKSSLPQHTAITAVSDGADALPFSETVVTQDDNPIDKW